MLIVLVPAEEQVGAAEAIPGTEGVDSIAALLKEADAAEVQVPVVAVTV